MRTYFIIFMLLVSIPVFSNTLTEEVTPVEAGTYEKINAKVIENVLNFYHLLPTVTGKIVALPRAGTIKVEFDSSKLSIHEGMKLVAKRKGIDKPLVGDGIIYLKYNKYGKLVGKYTRSEVGKFDIADLVSSKWYKPSFVIGTVIDETGEYQDFAKQIKLELIQTLIADKNIKYKNNKKVNKILHKMLTLSNNKRQMKVLFGLGVDYVLNLKIVKESEGYAFKFSIISTYINKAIVEMNLGINF